MRHSYPSSPKPGNRVAVPMDVSGSTDGPGQWVLCGGAIRDATDGRVTCPIYGTAVTLGECIGCHCLVTHSGERDPQTDCVIGEVT